MIAPKARGIYVIDVRGIVRHRDTKHCVCVSAGDGKYFLINTEHRPEYDDYRIGAADYPFLGGTDRFVACSVAFTIEPASRIRREVGILSRQDTVGLIALVEKSRKLQWDEKAAIVAELRHAQNQ